jgi:adenylate cyclase
VEAHGPGRTRLLSERAARHRRVLNVTAMISAAITAFFGIQGIFIGQDWWVTAINLGSTVAFVMIPRLCGMGELVAPIVFFVVSYCTITALCIYVGTGTGLQFYFVVAAAIILVVLGPDHIILASSLAAIGAATVILLEYFVPNDTGTQPPWAFKTSFALTVITAWILVVATIWFALREIRRTREAMEAEYERSERLLANILPATIAERLKDPSRHIIADRYDDASVLFADIAGYTERASDTSPTDLVRFLDRLYTDLDLLVDQHGLEKVKTSGDSYMVVSGVPEPRPDHIEALACLALDMADAVADLEDPNGRAVPLRIGLAAGPVVAGVVGASKFFYDVWGDAVNVASRMETTDVEGRIQVPQDVYERLNHAFVLEKRGEVEVKGKGVMQTWYLVARRDDHSVGSAPERRAPGPTTAAAPRSPRPAALP